MVSQILIVAKNDLAIFEKLSGNPAKSGPLDFGTKNNFPSFFVGEKGLTHI